MLKSFSFMPKEVSEDFFYDVWTEIQKLKWYFYKFARDNADEAMQRTLMHTLTHFQSDGNLQAYIKKLAREITKDNKKLVFVDFLEQTLAEDDDAPENSARVDTGRVSDFSNDIIQQMENEVDRRPEVAELALEFMDKFLILCESIIKHDTTTRYYPEVFMKSCLKLCNKCEGFNNICIDLYMEYSDDFNWFLHLDDNNVGTWKETDYLLISQNLSKRVKLINEDTEEEVQDADVEKFFLQGKLGVGASRKKIIKIPYEHIWEKMCDLIDSFETNEMKFIIGDQFIIRTLGGSLSVVNPDTYNYYDLVRMEILTNLLQETNGRLLNVGSSSIYLLCNADFNMKLKHRVIKGIPIDFEAIDITASVE